jgi:hypothetical protein
LTANRGKRIIQLACPQGGLYLDPLIIQEIIHAAAPKKETFIRA